MRRSKKRDHLVDVALQLFYRHGFHATGIDQIVAEAGIARMTLYKHFPSKVDLIVATLERRDDNFRSWLFGYMENQETSRDKILSLFDALDLWFKGEAFPEQSFFGCMFINASAEFSNPEHPAHKVAARHKVLLKDHLEKIIQGAGISSSEVLSSQLLLLKEGAIVTAQVSGDLEAANGAKRIAEMLLDTA